MKIRPLIRIVAILSAFVSFALNAHAETDWDQWFRERTSEYENAQKLSEQERIPILGQMLRINTGFMPPPLEGVRLDNYLRAQKDLLGIPGHSIYYRDRIMSPYLDFKEAKISGKISNRLDEFLNETLYDFPILGQLPSPETVKVLGDMLNETWETEFDKKSESRRFNSVAIFATKSLVDLALTEKPTDYGKLVSTEDMYRTLPAWQKWYAEVKTGERSFAFLGQPVSYRFKADGGVESTPRDASKDVLPWVAAKREEKKPAAQASPPPSPKRWQVPAIIAATAGLFAFVFYQLRKRRAKVA